MAPRPDAPGGDAEAAGPPGRDDVAGRRLGPYAEAPCSDWDPDGRRGGRSPTASGRSRRRRGRSSFRSRLRRPRRTFRPDGVAVPAPRSSVQPLAPAPLQGPVHRQRRAPRQARAAAGAHALLGARRRPRRDHRAAVTEKLERLEARRFARTRRRARTPSAEPRPHLRRARSRPRSEASRLRARRWAQCRYVDVQGRRCAARHGLEFHHRLPFGLGGDHAVANISLALPMLTTASWPRSTTAAKPWLGIAAREPRSGPWPTPACLHRTRAEPRVRAAVAGLCRWV